MISQIFPHCHFHWLKLLSPSLQPLPFEHYSLKFKHRILIFTIPSSISNKTTLPPWRSSNQRVLFPFPITYFNYQGKKKDAMELPKHTVFLLDIAACPGLQLTQALGHRKNATLLDAKPKEAYKLPHRLTRLPKMWSISWNNDNIFLFKLETQLSIARGYSLLLCLHRPIHMSSINPNNAKPTKD